MLFRAINVYLVIAAAVAVAVVIAARQAFYAYFQDDTAHAVETTSAHIHDIATILADVERAGESAGEARQRLEEAAIAGQQALAPLVSTASLRGSYLLPGEAGLARAAGDLRHDLGGLAEAAAQPTSLTQLGAQADRVAQQSKALRTSPATTEDAALVRAFWIRSYVRDVLAVDHDFQERVQDFRQWRVQQLETWAREDRWLEIEQRIEEMKEEIRATSERLSRLEVPPEARSAGTLYVDAIPHLEQSLESLGEYVAGRTTVSRPLRLSDEQLDQYRAQRENGLAALQEVAERAR